MSTKISRKGLFYLAGSILCLLLIVLEAYDLLTETQATWGSILRTLLHISVWGLLGWSWMLEYQKREKTTSDE